MTKTDKKMNEPHSKIEAHCAALTSPVGLFLSQIERETHLKTLSPNMLSGPFQGKFLQFLSRMIRPARALEIGTFTGYSAICLAEGLTSDGFLDTIEVDPAAAFLAKKHIEASDFAQKIRLHVGDAAQIVPSLGGPPFDLSFIDAGKLDSAVHFELALERTRAGGWILIDNLLWKGKVLASESSDATARALQAFGEAVRTDPRCENILLPLRDGLFLVQKL